MAALSMTPLQCSFLIPRCPLCPSFLAPRPPMLISGISKSLYEFFIFFPSLCALFYICKMMELPPPSICVFFFNTYYCVCTGSSICMHNPARVCWIPVALRPAPIPPFVPSGPLGVSPDPPLCPPVLVVFLCPPVLLVSLLIPPRVLRCPWCLLDPTVV